MFDIRKLAPAAALFAMALTGAAQAQNFPSKQLKIVVPQPAGGGFDAVGRIAGDKLQQILGQSVIVENKTGAGTRVGTDYVAKSAPDGYTLLVGANPNLNWNQVLYKDLTHDPIRDFTPAGLMVAFNYTLVARNDLAPKSFNDIVAYGKANSGKLTYASGGKGTGQHILMAVVMHLAGVNAVHVPYRGAQAAYQDVIAGRVDLFFDNATTARPLVEGGRVRAVAVSAANRLPYLPDTPTLMETGSANISLQTWFGIFAPAKTPEPVLKRLREAMAQVKADPAVRERLTKMGAQPLNLSTEEEIKRVNSDYEIWRKNMIEAKVDQ